MIILTTEDDAMEQGFDGVFLENISAIGIEDLFSNGNKLQSKSDTNARLGYLKKWTERRNPCRSSGIR
jgi:hypothetical protein